MATPAKSSQPVEKFCVVCGLGSHRSDWQTRDNPACDSHSQEEVAAAIKAKSKPAPAPAQTKPAATPANTAPAQGAATPSGNDAPPPAQNGPTK